MWCDTPAVNLNHRVTGGSTVHSIKQEICATGPVSPEIPTSVFVISLHGTLVKHPLPEENKHIETKDTDTDNARKKKKTSFQQDAAIAPKFLV